MLWKFISCRKTDGAFFGVKSSIFYQKWQKTILKGLILCVVLDLHPLLFFSYFYVQYFLL